MTSAPQTAEPPFLANSPNSTLLGRFRQLLGGMLVILTAGVAFGAGCRDLTDADVWWHLRAGQWVWQNQKVPTVDPFAFASGDRAWIDLHWFFQICLAAAFEAGSVGGMIVMAAGLSTIATILGLTVGCHRWPVWVAAVCWLPAIMAISARCAPRPELFSLLGVALYLAVLLRADNTPKLAWILPLVQVLWVNTHGLFVLGPIILVIYLADRLLGQTEMRGNRAKLAGSDRWWTHVGGAAVIVGLTCLGNPYGLRGAVFPLELFPKITAWGGEYKSYIIEFGDLRELLQKQGLGATSSLYVRAECFLLWIVPLSFIAPAVWRAGQTGKTLALAKWCIVNFGLAVALVLVSALGLPSAGIPEWLVQLGRLAPIGLLAIGVWSGAVLVTSSRLRALLAIMGGVASAIWVLWLRVHLLGPKAGPAAWFGGMGLPVPGLSAMLVGATTAVLLVHAGVRLFALVLAVAFSYLALQAIRNINLFALVAAYLTAWNLGEWSAQLIAQTRAQKRQPGAARLRDLAPPVAITSLVGWLFFTIISGQFFRANGDVRGFGLSELPLLYAHEAARFAGHASLPDRALVFDLTQAGVYLFHNGPEKKTFMDGRLEIPSRETFQTYVRVENMLNEGRPGWAEPVRRMGDPLMMLDHRKEFGAEATLLRDPGWRCIYYDAIASLFLAGHQGAGTIFPRVDFVKRHFNDPLWQAVPPIPAGVAEARALLDLSTALEYRDRLTGRLPLSLRLLACDRFRQAIVAHPSVAEYWRSLGICCWNMAPSPLSSLPGPSDPWDIATGLLPAQATFCFHHALELDPHDLTTIKALYHAFEMRGMRDVQQKFGVLIDRARADVLVGGDRTPSFGAEQAGAQLKREVEALPQQNRREHDELAETISELLEHGYSEAAIHLSADARNRGIAVDWLVNDRVATTLLHLGRPSDAIQMWQDAVGPPSAALREARIATAALAALEFEDAKLGYRAALELDPTLGEAWFGLAWLHTQLGDSSRALAACRQGLRQVLTPAQTLSLQRLQNLIEPIEPDR